MKSFRKFALSAALLVILASCGPAAQPATSVAVEGEAPALPAPTLEPINLAGPEMAVGSKWLYVDGTMLVAVPPGEFVMGREGGVDNPEQLISLSEFWMYRTKVTNVQFAFCVAQGACTPPSLTDNPAFVDPLKGGDPATGVTWHQAAAYCEFVHARLPTEAEWEKAARGPDGSLYPWGDQAPTCALLNFNNCLGKPSNVTLYPQGQSYYHALDMTGNTNEWVADFYKPDSYLVDQDIDPLGPLTAEKRVVRSSGFDSGSGQIPLFSRFFNRPEDHRGNLGFRCVVEEPAYYAPYCNYPAVYGTDGVGGSPSGEQIQVDCPALSINQVAGCEGSSPSTTVTLNGPAGSVVSVPEPACSSLSGPGDTTCTDHGKLSICSQCTVTTTSQPQCAPGYSFDAETESCVGQPAAGVCLPGFVPVDGEAAVADGLAQCCVLAQADGEVGDGGVVPVCPAGTFFDGAECISVEVVSPYCKTEGVALNSCQPGGGPGCPVQSCPYPKIWYPDLCKCDYPPNW